LKPQVIPAHAFEDQRGKVVFSNEFDLRPVRRFYYLIHPDTTVLRAWQGHKVEQKWFTCVKGCFIVNIIQPNDWTRPSGSESIEAIQLSADNPFILHLPGGYVTGIKASVPNSILFIYSDVDLETSKTDDFRFVQDTWNFKDY
jgi:dTDP-4-dehydrorhamnose 3,5-epimerase-like enzyme